MGKLDGSCLCGNVTYTCDADPIASANCHCRDCQSSSGAAFSTVAMVPADSIEIRGETLSIFRTIGQIMARRPSATSAATVARS